MWLGGDRGGEGDVDLKMALNDDRLSHRRHHALPVWVAPFLGPVSWGGVYRKGGWHPGMICSRGDTVTLMAVVRVPCSHQATLTSDPSQVQQGSDYWPPTHDSTCAGGSLDHCNT